MVREGETWQLVSKRDYTVSEKDGRMDTGLVVVQGDRLIFSASGSIWAGVMLTGSNGPAGWNNMDPDPKFPLPGSHPYALLGEIGGRLFYIGNALEITESVLAGTLVLRTNDDAPGNGSGAFHCNVELWRRR